MLIFDLSQPGRTASAQIPQPPITVDELNLLENLLRTQKPALPELSELQVARHFTRFSQKIFLIDTLFYPLGSCTMKYNPRGDASFSVFTGFP